MYRIQSVSDINVHAVLLDGIVQHGAYLPVRLRPMEKEQGKQTTKYSVTQFVSQILLSHL